VPTSKDFLSSKVGDFILEMLQNGLFFVTADVNNQTSVSAEHLVLDSCVNKLA